MRNLLERLVFAPFAHVRHGGRASMAWAARLTAAAVGSFVVATLILPGSLAPPLLAPLTALLVVQATPVSLLTSGFERVLAVVAGVVVAVGFSVIVPLTWWSLGLMVAAALLIGQAMRLSTNMLEVPISAMLVLGVGTFATESAAWRRIAETLVGAGVGVASNLLFPPRVAVEDAGSAINSLAQDVARNLMRASDELATADAGRGQLLPLATRWLGEARRITHDIPQVGGALLHAEQTRRLNLRAVGRSDAGPGLRQGLEGLEHCAVAVRSMFRAVRDAIDNPDWPTGETGEFVAVALGHVFRDLATALVAFGELVEAEAHPQRRSTTAEIARVNDGLEDLREALARLNDLLLVDRPPVLDEVYFALLSTVKRLLAELDLEARVRRQLQLRPAAGQRRIRRPLP